MRRLAGGAVMVAGILALVRPLGGSSHLVIRVVPRVARAPATVRVRIELEPKATDRGLDVVIESAVYYASTYVSLDGKAGRRLHVVAFRPVPVGKYKITATVGAAGKLSASAEQSIEILPR